jgi:hypothetical protein
MGQPERVKVDAKTGSFMKEQWSFDVLGYCYFQEHTIGPLAVKWHVICSTPSVQTNEKEGPTVKYAVNQ